MGGPQGGRALSVLHQTLASSLSLPRSSAWHFSKFFLKITEKMQNNFKYSNPKLKIMASGPITSWEIDGETVETVSDFNFGGSKSPQIVIAAMKLKDAYSLEGKL